MRRSLMRFLGVFIAAALFCTQLAGCAQMQGLGGGVSLAVAPGDPCGRERGRFAQTQGYFTREIVTRAVVGGLVGAGSGALIGAAAGGGRGALIGAAAGLGVGLAAGLASGYYEKLRQNNADDQALARQVDGDLNAESAQMSETAASFSSLRSCRFVQARLIKNNARNGSISRAEAETQLAAERSWFDQEVQAAQEAGLNMQKRDDQFAYAANKLPVSRRRSDPARVAQVAATETIPQKRNSFENTVKTAQAQSATTFSLDSTSGWLEHDDAPA